MPKHEAAQATDALEVEPARRPDLSVVGGTGGVADEVLTYDDEAAWETQGREFASRSEQTLWDYGYWIVAAEKTFDGEDKTKRPDRYTKAAEITHLGYGRCRNLACTARAFPLSRRRDNLSFAHHTVVARRKDADKWLAKAESERWSEKTLRLKVREGEGNAPPKARPERIVLTASTAWVRAAKAEGVSLKEWLIAAADRAAKANPPDDSGEGASA